MLLHNDWQGIIKLSDIHHTNNLDESLGGKIVSVCEEGVNGEENIRELKGRVDQLYMRGPVYLYKQVFKVA